MFKTVKSLKIYSQNRPTGTHDYTKNRVESALVSEAKVRIVILLAQTSDYFH